MATDIVLASELNVEFDVGVEAANLISMKVDGTSVVKDGVTGALGAPAPVWNNVTKEITFPAVNGGAPTVIDLSQFTTDIYVTGGTWDIASTTLTLSDNDGTTPDITVDLGTLLGVSADANNLLTNGTDNKSFLDAAAIRAIGTQQTSVFGTDLGYTINS